MSHIATNWAFSQKGLRPAEKLLLLCLADRHNPDQGCFPSQVRLADDAGMSRASVNENLTKLEAKGLIRRHQKIDARTRRQQNTRYILGFEEEFIQEPCPESGHGECETEDEQTSAPCPEIGLGAVSRIPAEPCPDSDESRVQNLDTNPVRVTNKITFDDARERAGGFSDFVREIVSAVGHPDLVTRPFWKLEAENGSFIEAWRAMGLTDAAILEAARSHAADMPAPPNGPKGLHRAMERKARGNTHVSTAQKRPKQTERKHTPLQERVAYFANLLSSGRYVPPSAITSTTRTALIKGGHITEDELRRRGL